MSLFDFTTHEEILTERPDDVTILEMYRRTCGRLKLLRMQYQALEQAHYALQQELEQVHERHEREINTGRIARRQ